MQACYPKKYPRTHWDTLNVDYPVRVLEQKDVSSEFIARKWRPEPEVLQHKTKTGEDVQEYRDNSYNECMRSQTALDYGYKIPEIKRFNKHTSCVENEYIYPLSRRVEDRPPACKVHGTTETKESFSTPPSYSRLITEKDQFKHPVSLENKPLTMTPSWHKELEQMDTTYEGFEKYLDPYLTTNRLHHRPYTADQLKKISNSKDIVTYYTLADSPWVWSRKPTHDDWFVRVKCPKTIYDREKFKGDLREIRIHNKLNWLPGSFRTEVKDNYNFSTHQKDINMEKHDEHLLTVYYESKCPDSKKFVLEQLQPAIELLHRYVKLRLIPFGKSRSINYGDDGFECQHGPEECLGNIVQECALRHMRGHSDIQRVTYVVCEMASESGAHASLGCVKHAGLSVSDVEGCVLAGEGVALQLDSEYHTDKLKPKFIPTVTLDGVFNQDFQDAAMTDLIGTLCATLREAAPCARYYNNRAWEYIFYNST
ncbi:GILT-like protein C02D5.2 [Papilio xuthus]|uniref:GILT-like protein C02D5.2 n=1 Tax=Papilio xuthus TaxID=66420 RepID=A0A194PGU4_PAPXU|nr:GILT-like protein C02D5.2 [Papilio xuthus]